MVGTKTIMIIALIIVGIAGIVFIKKKNETGNMLAVFIVALIAAFAAVLAIPTSTSEPGTESDADSDSDSGTESAADSKEINEIIHCEAEFEGIVKAYGSFTDINKHQRNDVIYMEYDGTPSSIIIHTNGNYSRISFDFYAVEKMNPSDMALLSFTSHNPNHPEHAYAAIPLYNPSGRFSENVTGSEEVRITFSNSGMPSADYQCAVIIDDLIIK